MSQINDQAAKKAAELLPCQAVMPEDRPHVCPEYSSCHNCRLRPAVAERLRELIEAADHVAEMLSESEKELADARDRIAALEAENAELLKHVDDAQNEAGALIRENERLRIVAIKAWGEEQLALQLEQLDAALAGRE